MVAKHTLRARVRSTATHLEGALHQTLLLGQPGGQRAEGGVGGHFHRLLRRAALVQVGEGEGGITADVVAAPQDGLAGLAGEGGGGHGARGCGKGHVRLGRGRPVMQVTGAAVRRQRSRSRPAEQAGSAVACAPCSSRLAARSSRLKPGHALEEDCTTSDCWASSAARWRAMASRCAAICSRCTTLRQRARSESSKRHKRSAGANRWRQPRFGARRREQPLRARAWRVISSSILATRSRSSLSAPFCERRSTTRRPAGKRRAALFPAKAARDVRPAGAPATAITGMRRDVAIAQTLLGGSAHGEGCLKRSADCCFSGAASPAPRQLQLVASPGPTDTGRAGAEWCAYKTQGRERCAARPSRRSGHAQTAARCPL